ncbi:unnamed protein product [Zymoseptoria tritici ST99CH_3D1]|nr:unnamed protein product [Zymoseptoria tritici ST99CH_3D1]
MKTTILFSTLFAATALAGFNVQQLPKSWSPLGKGDGSKMLLAREDGGTRDCQNHTDCKGICDNDPTGCGAGQEDYCFDPNKKCYCIAQKIPELCVCLYPPSIFGPLADSCRRGALGTDTFCVYGCGGFGVPGNAGCNSEGDPCLKE